MSIHDFVATLDSNDFAVVTDSLRAESNLVAIVEGSNNCEDWNPWG